MDVWCEARERYARGGITHRELAELYDLPLSTLRRRSSVEHWSALRSGRAGGDSAGDHSARNTRVSRQLELTDRMMDIIEKALGDKDELYGWIEFWKTTSAGEYVAERLGYLNDERFGRLVKTAAEVFELQRTVLGIHDYRDEISARKLECDADIARSKLEQQAQIAGRKLELELLRLENAQDESGATDDFLAALGMGEGDDEQPVQEE